MSSASHRQPTGQRARNRAWVRLAWGGLGALLLLGSAWLASYAPTAHADGGYPTPTIWYPPPPTFVPPPPLPTPFAPAQVQPVQPSPVPIMDNPGGSQPLKLPASLASRPTLICLFIACIFSLFALIIAIIVAANHARYFTKE